MGGGGGGGGTFPLQHLINLIENIQSEFSLHDIWHIKNPNTLSFTWSKGSPFIFCRLDFWLISDSLHDLVTPAEIFIASIKTDHSAIVLELQEIEENCKRPGFWLNTIIVKNVKNPVFFPNGYNFRQWRNSNRILQNVLVIYWSIYGALCICIRYRMHYRYLTRSLCFIFVRILPIAVPKL